MSTAPLLEITGLRGGYGRVEVLRGVDLQVLPGEDAMDGFYYALLGKR